MTSGWLTVEERLMAPQQTSHVALKRSFSHSVRTSRHFPLISSKTALEKRTRDHLTRKGQKGQASGNQTGSHSHDNEAWIRPSTHPRRLAMELRGEIRYTMMLSPDFRSPSAGASIDVKPESPTFQLRSSHGDGASQRGEFTISAGSLLVGIVAAHRPTFSNGAVKAANITWKSRRSIIPGEPLCRCSRTKMVISVQHAESIGADPHWRIARR